MRKAFTIQTIQLFIGLSCLLLVIGLLGDKVHASIKRAGSISCKTSFGERHFTIEGSTVAFHSKKSGRYLSSVRNSINQKTFTGFKKTLYIDNQRHFIHIENIKSFNDSEDFMTITSPKGHKITYPLNCRLES